MSLEESVAEVVTELAFGRDRVQTAVELGLGLAMATWSEQADEGSAQWDIFGLDVCAAAETLHLAVVPAGAAQRSTGSEASARRAMAQLLEAIAVRLEAEAAEDGQTLNRQLEIHAAAAQLRKGLDVLA